MLRRRRGAFSAFALVIANLIPVAGVLFLGWSAAGVVILYWAENIVVGFYTLLRIALLPAGRPVEHLAKVFIIPFFTVHFGGFCAVHGLFLMLLLGSGAAEPVFLGRSWPGPLVFLQLLVSVVAQVWRTRPPEMTYPLIALLASHGVSFLENYILGGEYRGARAQEQMTRPYRRVVITHITILAGAVPVLALGAPMALLLVLIAVKTLFDLHHHIESHKPVYSGQAERKASTTAAALSAASWKKVSTSLAPGPPPARSDSDRKAM